MSDPERPGAAPAGMETYDLDGPPPAPDEVELAGAAAGRRRRHRWSGAVAALVLVAVGLVVFDQHRTDQETARLLDRVAAGQASVSYTDGYVLSAVRYTSPLLTSAGASERVRAGLRAIVQDSAARQVPPLRRARDSVAAVPVLPWHRDLRRARSAYAAYLDERVAVIASTSTDFRTLYRPQTESDRLRLTARADLLAAAPDPADVSRIRSLFP